MGEIFIEGIGLVQIEGDTPNEVEQQAILGAIAETEDEDEEGEGEETTTDLSAFGGTGEEEPPVQEQGQPRIPAREGPLGIVSPEFRGRVRSSVESQPGLLQLLTELSPSAGGAMVGAGIGGSVAGPPGALGGGIIGGIIGELGAQETGVAPESELNLALAGAGPVAGMGVGKTFQLARRGLGKLTTSMPAARAANARNVARSTFEQFSTVGDAIFRRTKGAMARPASEIFAAARRAKVRIKPGLLVNTRNAIADTVKELEPVSAIPEVRQTIRALNQISEVLLNNPKGALLDEVVRVRSFVGGIVGRLRKKGGISLNTANRIFATLSDDLDKIAVSPFRKGRQARLAKAGISRAKLEFAVADFEEAIARATNMGADGLTINFKSVNKWLLDVTNPKSAKYDKNFATAMADEIPALKERLASLAMLDIAKSPGGPGSIVLRGQTAKFGRSIGAAVGSVAGLLGTGGSVVGGAMGAMAGAQIPEGIVALLMTKPGAKFLEGAAKFGRGQINRRTWAVLGTAAMRSLGELSEDGGEAATMNPRRPRRQTRGSKKRAARKEARSGEATR